jgi:hypothetical protein
MSSSCGGPPGEKAWGRRTAKPRTEILSHEARFHLPVRKEDYFVSGFLGVIRDLFWTSSPLPVAPLAFHSAASRPRRPVSRVVLTVLLLVQACEVVVQVGQLAIQAGRGNRGPRLSLLAFVKGTPENSRAPRVFGSALKPELLNTSTTDGTDNTDEYKDAESVIEKHRGHLSVSPIRFPESTSFPLNPCPSVSSVVPCSA